MNNLTPEQLSFRAGYEQGRFDAQVETAQQRHISYVCPQCHWSLDVQPAQQEPVAWMWRCKPYCNWPEWSVSLKRPADSGCDGHKRTEGYEDVPLYTSPPASKPWVGLTDEERRSLREWQKIQEELGPVWAPMMLYLYEAIEAKLKEKNNG